MNSRQILFALLRMQICGADVGEEITDALSPQILQEIYSLALKHDLAHLVGQSLSDLGCLGDDEISQKFKKQAMLAVYRHAKMEREFCSICNALEQAEIPFMPLKGAVIRKYYSQPWMRTSCDIDILVNNESLNRASKMIQEELGYKYQIKTSHDISLLSPSGVHLELHYELVEHAASDDQREVLADILERATPVSGWIYKKEISDAQFYFYHIAHMAKHFENGGCGIKAFLDLWILNYKVEFDREKREELLSSGGLLVFAKAVEKLMEVWLSDAEEDLLSRQLALFILTGGAYGTLKNNVVMRQVRKGGAFRYALYKIFLPYDVIKYSYPILQKHKWLLPAFWVIRWFNLVFCGKAASSLKFFKTNASMTGDERANIAGLMKKLGL